ncbi:MAG: undecaprenyldiphospho-muramoylpentapeptide beta-N-acetylglucosaminyltransferase [Myxococcales bacterium]|nr:undecaprenyldiphospho-muramoylpentapeptide beta-N-acetylglucosaminyltransferase [Myxococcales bacterium]
MSDSPSLKVIIAGGGTGGHLFPGVAIAEELRARGGATEVTFVGTARGIEARVLPPLGWPLELIDVSGLKTVGLRGMLRGLLRLPRALWQSLRLLRRYRPHVVVGVGGYASGPVVLAAWLMRIPTAICEQNSIPGFTNKLLGKVVRRVFVAFAQAGTFFSPQKTAQVGNPVRMDMLRRLAASAADTVEARHDRTRPAAIFVCGGSLGATAVNEVASRALIELAAQQAIRIVHQTGKADVEKISARYRDAGVHAEVHEFIADMATQYAAADVVIGRAGATTVAELAIVGKPTIFIPFPFAADNHQEHNAREMADAGAALMFRQAELTPSALAAAVAGLLADEAARDTMAAKMRAFAKPTAGAEIAAWCAAQARA